jgi:chorismate-pyruvate lyase
MEFPAQLDGLNVPTLDVLQRVLLISDGTLTEALAAAFLEPISVVKIAHQIRPVREPVDELKAEAGASVLARSILLRGERSGRNYVYAESLIALDRLPAPFRQQLENSNAPIGRLWMEHRLETRKEMLRAFRRPAAELAAHLGLAAEDELLVRSYRVFSGGAPIMVITEHFPARY